MKYRCTDFSALLEMFFSATQDEALTADIQSAENYFRKWWADFMDELGVQEKRPNDHSISRWSAFYMGVCCGYNSASENLIPEARPIQPGFTMETEEKSFARRLAYLTALKPAYSYALMSDTDSAAVVWEKLRAEHDGMPFECLLAGLLRTGEIMGIRKERARRRGV